MKEPGTFISLEREEIINIFQEIKDKYEYASPEEVVAHFLFRIYPDPAFMELEDIKLYRKIKYSLICFWRRADRKIKKYDAFYPPPPLLISSSYGIQQMLIR